MLDYSVLVQQIPQDGTFQKLIKKNKIYVDKTEIIYQLALSDTPMFLSRPRRFGKSIIISILEELYTHGVKPFKNENDEVQESYFKGLAIEKLWQDEKSYKVIHIDFSAFNKSNKEALEYVKSTGIEPFPSYECALAYYTFSYEFRKCIKEHIKKFNLQDKIDSSSIKDDLDVFKSLVSTLKTEELVLLIDEYDYHLTHVPENFTSAKEKTYYTNRIASFMQDIYSYVKLHSLNFRKVFITGITRYKDASIFTAGNTIKDISLDPTYGDIAGFTRDEIKKFFKEHLKYSASKLYDIEPDNIQPVHIEKLLDEMATFYDGYCFDKKMRHHVFSTISVLSFFGQDEPELSSFWYDLGGSPTILQKNALAILKEYQDKTLSLDQNYSVNYHDFVNPTSFENMQPATLLYQTGYLTLAKPLKNSAHLKFPNKEIFSSMINLLSQLVYKKDSLKKIKDSSLDFNMSDQDLLDLFNSFIIIADHEHVPIQQESQVVMAVQMFFANSDYDITVNRHNIFGKADLVIEIDNSMAFVFEFKYNFKKHNLKDKNLLEEAKEQIINKHYADILGFKTRAIALVYNEEARAFTELETVDTDKSKDICKAEN